MAETNFTLLVNLSKFFKDHRQIARIFISDKISTIQDIQNKITSIFGIENFFLLSQNEFLPPSEDLRILRKGDTIWAIPTKSGNLSYEKRELENNIEYSQNIFKKTKRKSNSAENGRDVDVPKKRKHQIHSADSQENDAREKSPKSEVKTKDTEETEVYIKCRKKKKENKYKDEEDTGTSKNKMQKQIENSKKKIDSESNKYTYLEKSINDYQVTVGNSLPEHVSIKKYTPIPTITDEYLKEKKINIVKIDYISKPLSENQIGTTSIDKIEIAPIQTGSEISQNSVYLNEPKSVSTNDPKCSSINEHKSSSNNGTNSNSIKINSGVKKTTKFFFMPGEQKIERPIKQKRSNMFKLNISPIVIKKLETTHDALLAETKRINTFNPDISPNATNKEKIETSCEKQEKEVKDTRYMSPVVTENDRQISQNSSYLNDPKSSSISPTITKNLETKQNAQLAEEKISNTFKPDISHSVTNKRKIETSCSKQEKGSRCDMSPAVTENEEMYVDVLDNNSEMLDNSNENIHIEKQKDEAIQNVPTPSEVTNGHSVEVSPAFYVQDTEIIPALPPEHADTSNASRMVDDSMETQADCSLLNKHSTFQRISRISPCVTTMLDTPIDDFGISGIEPINYSKYSARKQISGVGQLLSSIRESKSICEVLDATSNSDVGEFVTKRKRTRRTRSKKKKSTSTIPEETFSLTGSSTTSTPRPMFIAANPKLHIKFSDDEDIEKHD